MKRHMRSVVGLGLLVGLGSCADSPIQPLPPPQPWPGFVSDPISSGPLASRDALMAGAASVVYVSLAPGTLPGGMQVSVRNRATGSAGVAAMVAGGVDPVGITAGVGDTLDIAVQVTGSVEPLRFIDVVAPGRAPVVVRTDPPPRKRDVPLNSVVIVVFSEPIEPTTLTSANVQLLHGTTLVAGQLEFRDPANLTVAFVPAAPLAASTDYRLSITRGIHDLDGEALAALVSVEFTTGGVIPVLSQIVFVSWVIRDWDSVNTRFTLWAVNADGSGGRQLTNPPRSSDMDPAWSLDGRRIAFTRMDLPPNNDDNYPFPITNVHVMNADGSGVVGLSTSRRAQEPAWSPDGTKIAFADWDFRPDSSGLGGGGIHVMNADGTGDQLLVRAGYEVPGGPDGPAWSPDGRRIAFSSNSDIFVTDADGTGVTQLTSAPEAEYCPAWSPDGTKIAFRYTTDLGENQSDGSIYVMNADGSGVSRLTDPGVADCPSWSPDGTMIAFADFSGGLFVMNADGSGITRVNVPVPVLGHGGGVAWSRP